MKNHDKATANYAKLFTKKNGKSPVTQIEDSKDSTISPSSKCKLYEKEHGPNECWHLQAEYHYCHNVGHIANFCKKKSSSRTSPPKNLIMCTRSISSQVDQSLYILPSSCTVTSKHHESFVEKVIIDSGVTDHFFTNRAYFSTYEEYHHEFQTGSGKILIAYGYRDVVLRLPHPDSSEVTWTIKKVSWAPSLRNNLLCTIPLARKGVEVFLQQPHIPSEISYQEIFFGVADIIDNQYVVCTTGYFPNSTSDQGIINTVTPISIQT